MSKVAKVVIAVLAILLVAVVSVLIWYLATINAECEHGYQREGIHCNNIDECKEKTHNCTHDCHDTTPGFQCLCRDGYATTDGGVTCFAICSGAQACGFRGECVSPGECRCNSGHSGSNIGCSEFTCRDKPCGEHGTCTGPNQCTCQDGFHMVDDRCTNIDECAEGLQNCSHHCHDVTPGYYCSCNPGYKLIDGRSCSDINECETRTHNCTQHCNNTEPGFKCWCDDGYELVDDGVTCKVTCKDNPCGGNESCTGPNLCTCDDGFRSVDGNCANIDECAEDLHNCTHHCHDVIPGYNCSCNAGYELVDERSCSDINKCEIKTHNCTQHCNNTEPGFKCWCSDGYELAEDGATCKAICSGVHSCDDRGDCVSPGECRCKPGYDGSLSGCRTFTCKVELCGKHGHCTGPNQCSCEDGYQFTTTCEKLSSTTNLNYLLFLLIIPCIVVIVLILWRLDKLNFITNKKEKKRKEKPKIFHEIDYSSLRKDNLYVDLYRPN